MAALLTSMSKIRKKEVGRTTVTGVNLLKQIKKLFEMWTCLFEPSHLFKSAGCLLVTTQVCY